MKDYWENIYNKWQILKTPIPAASSGVLRGFALPGSDLLKYSFRASPGGTCGSGHFGISNKIVIQLLLEINNLGVQLDHV
ncbi:MAG: hypothetical protein ABFS17_02180 [Chloroflexota bacterium]